MELRNFYAAIGSDYDDVLYRLRSEERIYKYLKLVAQEPSITELKEGAESGDCEKMFRAAHTIKGVALNFGLTRIADAASALAEHLRDGKNTEGWEPMEKKLAQEIRFVLENITRLE